MVIIMMIGDKKDIPSDDYYIEYMKIIADYIEL
jgi:hypothetical protein